MPFPSHDFWRREALAFWDALDELALAAFLMGVHGGISIMPPSVVTLVNWDFINEAAIRYLRRYQLSVVNPIFETTRVQTVSAIEDWMRSGEHLSSLTERLRKLTFSKVRAKSIAMTETTRITAAGNLEAWRSTGVISGKKWMTAVDERVCPICRPLHGQIVEIDQGWTFTSADIAADENLQKALGGAVGISYVQPPAHVNCRCWMQPFVSETAVREQRRRRLGLE